MKKQASEKLVENLFRGCQIPEAHRAGEAVREGEGVRIIQSQAELGQVPYFRLRKNKGRHLTFYPIEVS